MKLVTLKKKTNPLKKPPYVYNYKALVDKMCYINEWLLVQFLLLIAPWPFSKSLHVLCRSVSPGKQRVGLEHIKVTFNFVQNLKQSHQHFHLQKSIWMQASIYSALPQAKLRRLLEWLIINLPLSPHDGLHLTLHLLLPPSQTHHRAWNSAVGSLFFLASKFKNIQ